MKPSFKKPREFTAEEISGMKALSNQQIENDMIGLVFKSHTVYMAVVKIIQPNYDFFGEVSKKLFCYLKDCKSHYSSEINKNSFGAYMAQNEERKEFYVKIKGWDTIEKLMNKVDEQSYKKYLSQLKKLALMRELFLKGFPTEKIRKMKKYETMSAEELRKTMFINLMHISTQINLGNDAILLGNDAVSKLLHLRETPDIGFGIADYNIMSMMLRGFRKGKLSLFGALSNIGKSRCLLNMAVHHAMYTKRPTLVIMNETDELDAFLCQMTTLLNNPIYGFNLGVKEGVLANGAYENEDQFNKVVDVAEWLEREANIYFIETTQYSDADLGREIQKYAIGKGVELVFYDTLKNNESDFAQLKKTTQFLRDTASEMNISVVASFQASDDTAIIAPQDITSMNIASAKHILHFCDSMFIFNVIKKENYHKYSYVTAFDDEWGDTGSERGLHDNKNYYYFKHLKNRAGAKMDLMFEVDLDYNKWIELGYAKTGG